MINTTVIEGTNLSNLNNGNVAAKGKSWATESISEELEDGELDESMAGGGQVKSETADDAGRVCIAVAILTPD